MELKKRMNNTISIYFSQDEYERAQKAMQHSVLGWNPLLKVFSELPRLIEVGASCFNHYCVGHDDT